MTMRIRRPRVFSILLVVLLLVQLACGRSNPLAGSSATPSPSPKQTELVDQILSRYEEALGGHEAIARVTSYTAQGTFETSVSRVRGTFEVWGKDPNKTLSVLEFPGNGELKKGFDGDVRWVQTPVGTFSDDSPKEMAELERDAEGYRAGKIKSLYESMRAEREARLNR